MEEENKPELKTRLLKRVAILPTLLTLGNGLCGMISIILVAGNNLGTGYKLLEGTWLIFLGMIFDALDGRIARVTKMSSRFGAQLDSLCDAITFGVAPALILYRLFGQIEIIPSKYATIIACFYLSCVLLRLARFNVESVQNKIFHTHFKGLPSPAAAGLLCSFVLLSFDTDINNNIKTWIINMLPFIAMISAILMVSRIDYTHIVNKLFSGAHNFLNLIEIILIVILVSLKPEIVVFTFFMSYTLIDPIKSIIRFILHKPAITKQVDTVESKDENL